MQDQLRSLGERGIECDLVVVNSGPDDYNKNSNIITKRIIGEAEYSPRYYAYAAGKLYVKIWHKIVRNDYDLVHVNSGLAAPMGLLQPTRPVVISFWGSDVMGAYLGGKSTDICDYCAKIADKTIVMSEEMDSKLTSDCEIVPHGVDLNKFKPINKQKAIDEVGWDPKEYNILFPYKKNRKEKRYNLAKKITRRAGEMTKKPINIHNVTGEPHERIPYYMNASDCLLITSTHEGSPNTVKEAMACNLPIVSTEVGDVVERLKGVSNTYVGTDSEELSSALANILMSEQRSDGRKKTSEFSIDKMGSDLVKIYKEAFRNHHGN
ncbi:glycosyltransferase family 4 protein [Natronococcus sp. JC468]|uniref:glycosyltransferase n=1 Tax=Natronococcus sp. JC468 TaxID=1961921 RepID=UPI00143B419C|nr:glycosyltransferase family 4 protein [Natronococcus sp. JC468]